MEQLGAWIKPIIAMIILAGFLELILPDNQLEKVTKLILGLVILMFLLQPLTRLLNLPSALAGSLLGTAGQNRAGPATGQVIREGLKMRDFWLREYRTERQNYLQSKLEQIITIFTGVKLQNVSCDFEGIRLKRVMVTVASLNKMVTRPGTLQKQTQQIIRSVQFVTGLNQDQIDVRWGEDNE